jgi:hypothetical protein
MIPRRKPCDKAFARRRLRAAESFMRVTEAASILGDTIDSYRPNSLVSNYVLAGIAASDALCCLALGEHSQSDNHREAIGLVERITPDGRELAKALSALLSLKTTAQYGAEPLTEGKVRRARRSAERLVNAARDRLGG